MIKNDRQLAITKARKVDFEYQLSALKILEQSLSNKILINAIESQIKTFERQIKEYNWLKQDKPSIITASIIDLPDILIKARIIKGLSQEDLANKLGLKAQQIQRYEGSGYETASFERIIFIAKTMGLQFEETRIRIEANPIHLNKYDSAFIQKATEKLQLRKNLLSI